MFSISMVYIGLLKLPFYLKIFSKCLLTYYQIAFGRYNTTSIIVLFNHSCKLNKGYKNIYKMTRL